MRNYTLILVTILFSIVTNAQDINNEIAIDDETPFLLGKINKDGLTSENYNQWFSKNFENYELDQATIKAIGSKLQEYQITLFMGTWCGDSKKEVPRFYKILEACDFPEDQLTVIALSRKSYMYKQSPNHYEAGLNIHRVPTFVFYKDRKEANRIIEHPVESLEKDILSILTSDDYQSNYEIVTKISNVLKEDGLNGLKKQRKKLVKAFDGKVSSMYELNTYGRILYSTNRSNEAIEVYKLNAKLFPENPRTHMSLANTLGINGNPKEAVKVIEKAIKLFPDNQDLVDNLKALNN
ncbi:thioredoxin family protein [Psychroserpens jangbogonensis]|uniref:thioredoxin family protein n=1 Tax=Psychroserpens jangbogonensis TaxID=1484460 RepID=UPI00069145F4|nr:thioredoxin family protein [Psychroserpens jangbogonensis]